MKLIHINILAILAFIIAIIVGIIIISEVEAQDRYQGTIRPEVELKSGVMIHNEQKNHWTRDR